MRSPVPPDTADETSLEPQARLGKVPVPLLSWETGLAQVFHHLSSLPPVGMRHFRRLLALAASQRLHWRPHTGGQSWVRIKTARYTGRFTLATALLSLRPQGDLPLQRTLACLAIELHLAGWSPEEFGPVCEWLRGIATGKGGNQLKNTLGHCDGLLALQQGVAALRERSTDRKTVTGHGTFDPAWVSWLDAVVARLLMPWQASDDDGDDKTTFPLDGQRADPPDPLIEDPAESDIVPGCELEAVERAERRHGLQNRLAAAVGKEIHRRTSPELLRDPETILPTPVATNAWRRAVDVLRGDLGAKDVANAEMGLARILSIEAGLSRLEAQITEFGEGSAAACPRIDLDTGALRRPESRPRSAYSPTPAAESFWEPTGGDLVFPLSGEAVSLARELLQVRGAGGVHNDIRLLLTQDLRLADGEKRVLAPAPASRGAVFEPTRSATKVTYRKRLAARLAEELGPDAAQIAFGDTFGASAAPSYYGAYPAEAIATVLARANADVTGNRAPLSAPLRAACAHTVGSRVRPYRQAFADAWGAVGVSLEPRRGRPRSMAATGTWKSRRDSLALHLMLASGHRPVSSLGRIRLDDFLPSCAMAVIRDKRSDPARQTRLVATGWRFVGVLEAYVADLHRVAEDANGDDSSRTLARSILRGRQPLLSLPAADGSMEVFDTAQLLARLPAAWHERPNLYRHALNQALIRAGVDPEYRYFQMGWLEGDVHAVSDMSPYPPENLGPILANPIDDWLQSVGWLGGCVPKDPSAILGSMRLRNFDEDRQAQQAEVVRHTHELKKALAERRRQATPEVIEVLVEGIRSLSTGLVPVLPKGSAGPLRLRLKSADEERTHVSREMVDTLLAQFQLRRYEPLHAYLGARILSAALLEAVKREQCTASLPSFRHPSFKSVPSPFLPGLGLAVAISDELRAALVSVAGDKSADAGWNRWKAHLAIWAILANTPYRTIEEARSIALAMAKATHSASQGWLYRVPHGEGHVVITGQPALLLKRLQQEAGWRESLEALTPTGLAEFVAKFLRGRVPPETSLSDLSNWMVGALATSGAAELSGPERLVMSRVLQPATVPATRIAAVEDGVSLPGPEAKEKGRATRGERGGCLAGIGPSPRTGDRTLRVLMRRFYPRYRGTIGGKPALPPAHRVKQLMPLVDDRLVTLGEAPTLPKMILGYVKHLMTEGGPRSKGGMRLGPIYGIYHCIAPSLAAIPPSTDLRTVDDELLTCALLTSIAMSRRKNKRVVLDEVRRFIRFVREKHDVVEPDWGLIYMQAGEAIRGKDPAIISDQEVTEILQVLVDNLQPEMLDGVDPVERRVRELMLATALVAEASSARPQSVYGLTLADIHLDEGGDYIHLRTAGRFAEVKTQTAAGYVPLDGEIWAKHRAWFVDWVRGLRSELDVDDWIAVPLFAEPETQVGERFRDTDVYKRLGELVRWRTRQPRGHSYWLRKRAVGRRHLSLKQEGKCTARDAYQILKVCGHATIATPLASYIGDPLAWTRVEGSVATASERRTAKALSGTSIAVLDQRWLRRRGASKGDAPLDGPDRLAAALHLGPANWPREPLPDTPAYDPYLKGLRLPAVEEVMAHLAKGLGAEAVAEKSSVHAKNVNAIVERCKELARRTGISILTGALSRPRPTEEYKLFMDRLARAPRGLGRLAKEWAACARIVAPPFAIVLIDGDAVTDLVALVGDIDRELRDIEAEDGNRGYYIPGKAKAIYGSEKLLPWVLAVIWVANGLSACSGLELSD